MLPGITNVGVIATLEIEALAEKANRSGLVADAAGCIAALERSLPRSDQAQERVNILCDILRNSPENSTLERIASRAAFNEFLNAQSNGIPSIVVDPNLETRITRHHYNDYPAAEPQKQKDDLRRSFVQTRPWAVADDIATTSISGAVPGSYSERLSRNLVDALNRQGIYSAQADILDRNYVITVHGNGDIAKLKSLTQQAQQAPAVLIKEPVRPPKEPSYITLPSDVLTPR